MSPRVMMMSLWRNDAGRRLDERIEHLLSKNYPNLRWVWVVGDSEDGTESALREIAKSNLMIEVVRADTGIEGSEPHDRLRRLSQSASVGLDQARLQDRYIVVHESDIISPVDVVERLLATGKCPVAGWPVLTCQDGTKIFYDTWAYRREGVKFSNTLPYHFCYRADELFQVDSVGTVWMFHAQDARAGVRCEKLAAVELCRKLKELGRTIWVDPTLEVFQRPDLWVPQPHPKES